MQIRLINPDGFKVGVIDVDEHLFETVKVIEFQERHFTFDYFSHDISEGTLESVWRESRRTHRVQPNELRQ